jgi:NAD(P)-dependent dehydrogenase (short-subunit alcohol dehydrogenase family)
MRRGAVRSRGFGFQAEAILRAVSSGCSFLEIALAVDSRNLLPARSVTLRNIVDAGFTLARLTFDLGVRRGGIIWKSASDAGARSSERRGEPRSVAPLRIVVFGASSGIGEHLARALAEDGHHLFIAARRGDRLAAIAQSSDRIEAFACDTSKEAEVRRFAETLSASVDAVDAVINCVGTFGEIGPIGSADSARWWQTIETNLRGAFLIAHHMVPLLRKGEWPRLINFSGGGAFSPVANYSAYACSKSGIIRLTECLADELAAANIRVNAVAPGFVPTAMHEATLAAGEDRAGRLQYRRTRAILDQQGLSMDQVVNCVRTMLSPSFDELTGKTISSNFDPWQSPRFLDSLSDIARSDLYTMRRINIVNLPDGRLRRTLSQPWADAPSDQ